MDGIKWIQDSISRRKRFDRLEDNTTHQHLPLCRDRIALLAPSVSTAVEVRCCILCGRLHFCVAYVTPSLTETGNLELSIFPGWLIFRTEKRYHKHAKCEYMAFNFSTQANPAADRPGRAPSPAAGGSSGFAAGGSGFDATSAPANALDRFDPTIQQQLFDASIRGDVDTAKQLLKQNTNVDAKDQRVKVLCVVQVHYLAKYAKLAG